MSGNQFEVFSESLLNIVKGKALYSGNSIDSFQEITEAASSTLNVARASIWMYSHDRSSIKSMDLYERASGHHSMGDELSKVDFPVYFAAMAEDRFINADEAHHDPRTIEFSKDYLSPLGIESMLDAPIRFGGQTIGVICLEHIGKFRRWKSEEITYASSLADLVSHAVEAQKRSIAESALLKSEARYRSLVENIPDVIYKTDLAGVITYVSPSVHLVAGYSPEEAIGLKLAEQVYAEPKERELFLAEILKNGNVKNFEAQLLRKDGSRWWGSASAHIVRSDDGSAASVEGIIRDISVQKIAQDKLSYQAVHDSLTGLINRHEFEIRVSRLLANKKSGDDCHAMCFMDLDQFKVVNDTCGHVAGDELLHKLGQLLLGTINKGDTLARLGGDEFGVLMKHCTLEQAYNAADEILKAVMSYQFLWAGKVFRIGVSIGLVAITNTRADFTELFRQADAACYLAKDMGRNRIHAYHPDDAELAVRHREMNWVGLINQALDEDRFCLYAQPIVPLNGGEHRHYELLIRMLDEQGEIILPGAFLPAAERYNLIEKLDAWVVKHACNFLARHPLFCAKVDFVTINLSGPSLTNQVFLESILRVFKETGVSPSMVCFEVTETVAISNLDSAISFIHNLKKSGFRFALDDFGSGISSFGYLKNLPVDYLKIDGMFVKGIVDDPIDYAMLKSINEIGQVMGMQTIAEFVENDEIRDMLSAVGVDYGQGYGLGRPRPLKDLVAQPY
ncbi:MAG: diguanylate cyclase (GGDEF)-like protein/PAS domain S-box-containing protein [Alphaproteobacteria bacterium]|jgi:diguanylate cyclase (GGDEF)-like protein/PAS domain S-box-containing protein